jgi:two-component system chemotaxis sensor kinase CheA
MNFADNYRAEASDLLADLETALLELETQPDCQELTDRVFRDLHTIKGSGAMLGFNDIALFSHEVESTYELVRAGKLTVMPRLISLTLLARDHITTLLDSGANPELLRVGEQIIEGFLELQKTAGLFKAQHSPAGVTPPASAAAVPPREPGHRCSYRIRFKPPEKVFIRALNLRLMFLDLQSVGECSVTCHTQLLPDLDDFRFETCYLFWDIVLTTDQGEAAVRDVFLFMEDDAELQIVALGEPDEDLDEQRLGDILVGTGTIAQDQLRAALAEQEHLSAVKPGAVKSEVPSLRVAADKLDDLVNIVGEIVTMQARLTQVAAVCGDPEVGFVAEEMERLTDKLRDSTLSIRMLPIGATFGTYRRLVRDLSRDLGKEIELITEGGDTELDKTVIDRINDPLVHLIRNCVDHGIELPSERTAVGKPTTGKIRLTASHSGAHVIITIRDDGGGLNKSAIRQKAIGKGLIKEDENLTEKELFALILTPGFSTAKTLTGVSGRGVGMDIVKQNVEGLRGTLELSSEEGKGTTFNLKLPLTLAIIDGLLVRVGGQYFVLPLANILECFELSEEAIARNRSREFVTVRDEMVPYVEIRKHFGIAGPRPAISQLMIAETPQGKFGFLVDLVIGDHKTVIKRLGGLFNNIESISGAAILGDGKIALILDLGEVAKEAMEANCLPALR